MMSRARHFALSGTQPQWEDTAPMPRLEPRAAAAAPAPATGGNAEPPFERVAQGLEMRELEGPTVFDQLFGGKSRR